MAKKTSLAKWLTNKELILALVLFVGAAVLFTFYVQQNKKYNQSEASYGYSNPGVGFNSIIEVKYANNLWDANVTYNVNITGANASLIREEWNIYNGNYSNRIVLRNGIKSSGSIISTGLKPGSYYVFTLTSADNGTGESYNSQFFYAPSSVYISNTSEQKYNRDGWNVNLNYVVRPGTTNVKASLVRFRGDNNGGWTSKIVMKNGISSTGSIISTSMAPDSLYKFVFYSGDNGSGTELDTYYYFTSSNPSYGYQNPPKVQTKLSGTIKKSGSKTNVEGATVWVLGQKAITNKYGVYAFTNLNTSTVGDLNVVQVQPKGSQVITSKQFPITPGQTNTLPDIYVP